VWSVADGFVQGMWRPPFFMQMLLIGKQDQDDRELGMRLGGLAFVASHGSLPPEETRWPRSDTYD